MNNVQSVRKETNRRSTKLFIFVVVINWLFVLPAGYFGWFIVAYLAEPFGAILLLGVLLKGILTIGLMRFDNRSRIIDAIFSLMLFYLLVTFFTQEWLPLTDLYNAILYFSFLLMQFSILIFHPSTVRLFHQEQE